VETRCSYRRMPIALVALVALLVVLASAAASDASAGGTAPTARVRALSALRRERGAVAGTGSRARRARARAAVVGGAVASAAQFPWQVSIYYEPEAGEAFLLCGGSIIEVHGVIEVLTAAHCVFEGIAPAKLVVVAGASTSPLEGLPEGEGVERRSVLSARTHPDYQPTVFPSPDDVAVLSLAEPPALSSSVAPVALTSSRTQPSEGLAASFSGFGEESWGQEPSGALNSLGLTLKFTRECGLTERALEASAVLLCGASASGSACEDDEGGALVSGSQASEIGVFDAAGASAGVPCADGSTNVFANITAPEIAEFIEGAEDPPLAPRGKGLVIEGVLSAGHSLTCTPGTWGNGPTFTYSFINSAGRQVLQEGSASTYALTASDVGRTIYCQLQASNAGGAALARTGALEAIRPGAVATAPAVATQTASTEPAPAEPSTGVLGSSTEAISPARIAALLKKALAPTGRSAKLASVTSGGGATVVFDAPEAGSVSIAWYRAAAAAGSARGATAKRLLVASGHKALSKAGTARIAIRLTSAGKRALHGRSRVALTAQGKFTTSGAAPVTASKGFVLTH
jgi:hypothetical protein